MKKRIYDTLNKVYGILMTVSFFGGFLPILPFMLAIIIGGEVGENIAVFLHKQYYPWVIVLGSFAIIIGLIAMYVGKLEGLAINNMNTKVENDSKQKNK